MRLCDYASKAINKTGETGFGSQYLRCIDLRVRAAGLGHQKWHSIAAQILCRSLRIVDSEPYRLLSGLLEQKWLVRINFILASGSKVG